jgi:hypothetical protein
MIGRSESVSQAIEAGSKERVPVGPGATSGRASNNYVTGLFKANFSSSCSHRLAQNFQNNFVARKSARAGSVFTRGKSFLRERAAVFRQPSGHNRAGKTNPNREKIFEADGRGGALTPSPSAARPCRR